MSNDTLSDDRDADGLFVDGPRRSRGRGREHGVSQSEHDARAARLEAAARLRGERKKATRIGRLIRGEFAPTRRASTPSEPPAPWRPKCVPPGPKPYTAEQRDAARVAFADARRSGAVTPPSVCECCDRALPLHGHHTDYAEPLRVLWLCGECHRLAHGFARPAELIAAEDALNGT